MSVSIPDELERSVRAGGPAEARWLAALPTAVDRLCDVWKLSPDTALAGGSASLVLCVTRADGTSAVLKLGRPRGGSLEGQARVLRLADGRGYARLLGHDDAANALLVEQLGPSLASEGRDADAQIELLVDVLRRTWRPAASPDGWITGARKAAGLAAFVEEAADPSLLRTDTVRAALAFARECEAAYEPSGAVVVHGDPHADNLLGDPLEPGAYRFVDPDGLFIEPAYDLGVVLRGFNDELLSGDAAALGRARCERIADRAGVDTAAIWRWAFLERVSTGLYLARTGRHELAVETLTVADRWSGARR